MWKQQPAASVNDMTPKVSTVSKVAEFSSQQLISPQHLRQDVVCAMWSSAAPPPHLLSKKSHCRLSDKVKLER